MFGFVRGIADRVWATAYQRDPKFPAAERKFIAANPKCFLCGGKSKTAHHTFPVHAYPELEMVEGWWRPVCHSCHFDYCHNENWSLWVDRNILDRISGLVIKHGSRVLKSQQVVFLIHYNTLGPKRPL